MTYRESHKVICVFCGKERVVESITDDGCDYYGHHRETEDVQYYDEGCDCALGKLEQKNAHIRAMCLNCKYLNGVRCVNKKLLRGISDIFDFEETPRIKDLTKSCNSWELHLGIFYRIVKR